MDHFEQTGLDCLELNDWMLENHPVIFHASKYVSDYSALLNFWAKIYLGILS